MTDVIVVDIDGVLSDCTERFRTLYEGKWIPGECPRGAIPMTNYYNPDIIGIQAPVSKNDLWFNRDTGALYLSDGEHLLKDTKPLTHIMKRNPNWAPDWERFHDERMDSEPAHREYVQLVQLLAWSYEIDLVTARSEIYRERTRKWLQSWGVPYTRLYMRHEDQGWENSKRTAMIDIIDNRNRRVKLAIDDDNGNRAMYNSFGVPFLYVERNHHEGEVLANN